MNTSYPLFRTFQDQRWIDRCKDREINGGYIQINDFIFRYGMTKPSDRKLDFTAETLCYFIENNKGRD